MQKFYSIKIPNKLLHVINRVKDFNSRSDLSDPNNFIQLASLKIPKEKTLKAHMHIWRDICYKKIIAQEAWVVIEGSLKVFFYDLDKKLIATEILYKGDCSITFEGGHNFTALEENTMIYEFKNGPYEGAEKDRVLI